MLKCFSPVDGSVFAQRPVVTPQEARGIIGRARAAQRVWASRPLAERVALVRAGVAALGAMGDEVVVEIAHMMGRPVRYGGRAVSDDTVRSVLSFFFVFFATWAVSAALLSLIGLDPVTAISGAATTIANVGPGLGPIIGPAGTFQPLPDAAKWVMTLTMLIGRLEVFTMLVLLTPGFWRR